MWRGRTIKKRCSRRGNKEIVFKMDGRKTVDAVKPQFLYLDTRWWDECKPQPSEMETEMHLWGIQ